MDKRQRANDDDDQKGGSIYGMVTDKHDRTECGKDKGAEEEDWRANNKKVGQKGRIGEQSGHGKKK